MEWAYADEPVAPEGLPKAFSDAAVSHLPLWRAWRKWVGKHGVMPPVLKFKGAAPSMYVIVLSFFLFFFTSLVPVPLIDRARARACAPGTGRSRSCSVFPSSQRWTPSRAFQLNTRYSATKCGVDGSTQSLDCTYSHIQRLAWQTKKMAHSLRQVAGNAVLSRRVMVASRSTWTNLKAFRQRCSDTLPFHNELAELCLQLLAMHRDQPVVEADSPLPDAAAAAPVQVNWKDFSPPPSYKVK